MTLGIEVRDVHLRYGSVRALDGLSLRLTGGKIVGLLGRNGSGKTSLLSLLGAFRPPTSGQVLVGDRDPFKSDEVAGQICLIRESGDVYASERVATVIDFARKVRPSFDADYADHLLELFQLPRRRRVQALSRGQRSSLGVVLGLASRAPLTIFDEVYLGMDAPARYAFYDALLADYVEHPRTIILSTHLIDEVARLFEEVVIIDRGRLILHEEADVLRDRGAAVVGPADAVDEFVGSLSREGEVTTLGHQRMGGTKSTTIFGQLQHHQRARAAAAGLELGPVALQDLFVHLTAAQEASR